MTPQKQIVCVCVRVCMRACVFVLCEDDLYVCNSVCASPFNQLPDGDGKCPFWAWES